MKKKILDISSPEKREEVSIKRGEKKSRPKNRRKSPKPIILVLTIGVLLLLVWLSSDFYSKATVFLYPEAETQTLSEEIEVNINTNSPDFENRVIPGRFFRKEVSVTKTFEATGRDDVGGKAKGTIVVYNSHTPPRSINLKATTRFLSSEEGKIFRAPERIYLPPATIEGGETIPGSKQVEVEAQEVGDDYNIGPSNFSVPGLAGSDLYYSIWAESTESMEGGFQSETRLVAEEDLENAEESLKEELKKKAKGLLQKEVGEEIVLNTNSMIVEDFEFSCSAKVGEKTSEFECSGNISVKALGFASTDLEKIARSVLTTRLSTSKEFFEESLSVESYPKNLVSETGKVILDLSIRADTYEKIREENTPSKLAGGSKKDIKDLVFGAYPQVKEVKINFSPFWVTKSPSSADRIRVLVKNLRESN